MQNNSLRKKEFMGKWLKGLQKYNSSSKDMNFLERKKAIKITSDIAMASTRKAGTFWSQALLANASNDDSNKTILEHMLGTNSKIVERASTTLLGLANNNSKKIRSKKILKKSCMAKRVKRIDSHVGLACCVIAKKLMKKRTQVLKNLVPGGKYLKKDSLIRETLDYIASLRVQVDVMRSLAYATEHLHCQQSLVVKPQ
ncbi:DNA-binding transcription factor [Lithospermum erythrorhizon]|uniref:DNA-binding transcription factor n=1 Tax=Lithospermum erythrorhizon TaxID=34254 RepID=A0AAV3P913_LITER